MATIITVHGTFAHVEGGASAPVEQPWWKPGSSFAGEVSSLVEGTTPEGAKAPVAFESFEWSGENSEIARRTAGEALLGKLRELDAKGENYCVLGHSHGGSVISSALLASARRKKPLSGLKAWMTVGTPFVELRRETMLFERLNLIKKVILVASLMLLIMFLVYVAGQLIAGSSSLEDFSSSRNILAAVLMSIPAIVLTAVLRFFDSRSLFFYRGKTIKRARASYGEKWTSFWHPSDEAVQGLRSLGNAKVELFDPSFAVQRLTLIAVFILPFAYLVAVNWPAAMVGLANYLRDNVYQVSRYEARAATFDQDRAAVRRMATGVSRNTTTRSTAADKAEWTHVREMRRQLTDKYPDHSRIARALRFKCEFLEESTRPAAEIPAKERCNKANRVPCANNTLCGGGTNFAYNTKLVYHLFTDDVTSAIINDDTRYGNWGVLIWAVIPMVLVPLASILLALLITLIIRGLSKIVSKLLASIFNRITLAEIKREIYGNDTEGEVAIGAAPRPAWLGTGGPQLPAEVAEPITKIANAATEASLAKFRNAISEIVLADGHPKDASIVSNYLTWKELVHTCYFDEPRFRKLVAAAVASSEGFEAAPRFKSDADFERVRGWLAALRQDRPVSGPPAVVAAAA